MKRALVPGVLVLLLALSACSGGETTGGQADAMPAATTAQSGAETQESLTAAPSAAPVEEDSPESAYLAAIHEARAGKILSAKTQIPDATDAQLIEAARKACDLVAAGQPTETITVIDGETQDSAGYFMDSSAITSAATKTICP